MSKRTKSKAKRVTGDILDFHAELKHLLRQYSKAGCCPGCISEALVKAAVGMVVTTGGICWPAAYPEEVEMITALAKRIVTRVAGAPSGVTLQ